MSGRTSYVWLSPPRLSFYFVIRALFVSKTWSCIKNVTPHLGVHSNDKIHEACLLVGVFRTNPWQNSQESLRILWIIDVKVVLAASCMLLFQEIMSLITWELFLWKRLSEEPHDSLYFRSRRRLAWIFCGNFRHKKRCKTCGNYGITTLNSWRTSFPIMLLHTSLLHRHGTLRWVFNKCHLLRKWGRVFVASVLGYRIPFSIVSEATKASRL